MDQIEGLNTEGIAIIGMSCRFPQAKTPEQFWKNLKEAKECVTKFTKEDLLAAGVDPGIINYPGYVNSGIVLEDIELFDAAFFGYSPRDAEIIDPQQRLFLECSSEALESSGYNQEVYPGAIGVYGGVDISYYQFNLYSNPEVFNSVGMYAINLNNDKDYVTTRVAYKLNLKGPAVTVQATCATSLVAISQACQSLLSYQCDMALAGASAISLPQKVGYFYHEGGIASPDGHCRAFDAKARGTTGGSGVGVVVLKRLDEALQDGDYIHAIIRGFGVNNDGADKVGFTAPSVNGQAEAISMAHGMANINPKNITYVEAHGTGTVLGDPIEVNALTKAFRNGTEKKGYCGIGSVKTNIGHCNSAAGVAGLIKTIMAMKNKMIPPSLHFTHPNPNIDFENSPFYVVNELRDWEANGTPRIAGISSFGIGGTNAHLVLEEAPVAAPSGTSRPWQVLMLSAKTPAALDVIYTNILQFLKEKEGYSLADVAYTLQVGRREFQYRKMLVLPQKSPVELKKLLTKDNADAGVTSKCGESSKSVVFMFPGQGSQYCNMGMGLYQQETGFKEQVDYCCEQLIPHLGLDLRTIIFPGEEASVETNEKLKQTALAQPALFVIEYALAQLWMSWGIKPGAMIGHSIGELVAACLSGVFSINDALEVVAYRGKLMQELPGGAMLVVFKPQVEIEPLLNQELSIAAVNSPGTCVVSGTFSAVDELKKLLEQKEISFQPLVTSHAFHSHMLDPVLDKFEEKLRSIKLNPPLIPYLSNTTGTWITAEQATSPQYWGRHIRQAVKFSENIQELLTDTNRIFLEVGPGNSLTTLLYQHKVKSEGETAFPSLPHPRDKQPDEKVLISAVGHLWLNGFRINTENFYNAENRRRLPLPTYPFEKQKFWVEAGSRVANGQLDQRVNDINQWFYVPDWKRSQSPAESYTDNFKRANNYLIFDDLQDVGSSIVKRVMDEGRKIIRVLKRDAFEQIDEFTFGINPTSKTDYFTLFQRLANLQVLPEVIIYLWAHTARNISDNGYPFLNGLNPDFRNLMYLCQAMAESNLASPVKLKVIANHLTKLDRLEIIQPEKALTVGACKVISQEFNINCQCIDFDPGLLKKNTPDAFAAGLMDEINYNNTDALVAYRNGQRWVQTYKSVPLIIENRPKTVIRKGGVYLITGGLGGIGLALARHFGKKYTAKLILTGRTPFPAEEQWADWLSAHKDDDPQSQKIRQLQQLKEMGAEVIFLNADIARLEEVQYLAEIIKERFGKLNGIIHCAGIAGGGIVAIKTDDQASKVIDPKVKGALNLEEVFGKLNLDFFVLCSSLAAIVGGVGQIDYCAANKFLDAFAHAKNSLFKTHYTSINWDTWAEVGMAVNTKVPDELKQGQQEALKNGIRTDEGLQAFEHILSSGLPQVLVSTANLKARIERMASAHLLIKQAESSTPTVSKPASTHVRPAMSTAYVAASTPTEQKLRDIWIELLGIEAIGINDNFLELGGHSLLAIQLISRIRSAFNIELSMQSFFEEPTIAAINQAINSKQGADGETAKTAKPALTRLSRENYRVQNPPGDETKA